MMSYFFHEHLHRGPSARDRLRTFPITICGAGAIGANLAESLARVGSQHLRVIDRDRVEARNLSTQPYLRDDVGACKATILGHMLYRAVEAEVEAIPKALTQDTVKKLLRGSALVVDAFDNSGSRALVTAWCHQEAMPCLHVGLADGYAEIAWNEGYRVPSATQDNICDYPLARNLVLLAVSVAAEAIIHYILHGVQRNYEVTLRDLKIMSRDASVVS